MVRIIVVMMLICSPVWACEIRDVGLSAYLCRDSYWSACMDKAREEANAWDRFFVGGNKQCKIEILLIA